MSRFFGGMGVVLLCLIMFQEKGGAEEEFLEQRMILTQVEVEKTVAYAQYNKKRDNDLSEIYYLICLVKDSPYRFNKDGKKYSGEFAAFALKHILNKEQESIRSAEGFIEALSTYMDGEEASCEVIYPDGSSAPATEVLYNELSRLREHEKNTTYSKLRAGKDEQI